MQNNLYAFKCTFSAYQYTTINNEINTKSTAVNLTSTNWVRGNGVIKWESNVNIYCHIFRKHKYLLMHTSAYFIFPKNLIRLLRAIFTYNWTLLFGFKIWFVFKWYERVFVHNAFVNCIRKESNVYNRLAKAVQYFAVVGLQCK